MNSTCASASSQAPNSRSTLPRSTAIGTESGASFWARVSSRHASKNQERPSYARPRACRAGTKSGSTWRALELDDRFVVLSLPQVHLAPRERFLLLRLGTLGTGR